MATLIRTACLLLTLVFSMSAFTLSLQEAKSQGYVGEQPTGYLGVVDKSTIAIEALIKDINAQRREAYEGIAKKNQTTVEAVEKLAGKKAIQKTPSGQYIKLNGRWQKVK